MNPDDKAWWLYLGIMIGLAGDVTQGILNFWSCFPLEDK